MDTSNTRSLSVDMKRQLNSADENQQCNKQIVINNQDEQHNIEQREQEQQQTLIITEDKPQNTEHAEDMEDTENRITVWAGGTTFTINKNILIDKSLYFRAMFGGAFKEKHQQEIHIEVSIYNLIS